MFGRRRQFRKVRCLPKFVHCINLRHSNAKLNPFLKLRLLVRKSNNFIDVKFLKFRFASFYLK